MEEKGVWRGGDRQSGTPPPPEFAPSAQVPALPPTNCGIGDSLQTGMTFVTYVPWVCAVIRIFTSEMSLQPRSPVDLLHLRRVWELLTWSQRQRKWRGVSGPAPQLPSLLGLCTTAEPSFHALTHIF
jgi:hypothetical protein